MAIAVLSEIRRFVEDTVVSLINCRNYRQRTASILLELLVLISTATSCWSPRNSSLQPYAGNLLIVLTHMYKTVPHRTAPHRTAPHRTAPHRTAPHRHRTAPHRTAQHRTAPHRTAPHRIVLPSKTSHGKYDIINSSNPGTEDG